MKASRYLVGIDLGTTHTVVAYADTDNTASTLKPRLFEIEQLVAPGEIAARPLLPSLRYHPAAGELATGDIRIPWAEPEMGLSLPAAIMGELARELGSKVPGQLVTSAKSWLSHASVDRTAPILPWGGVEGISKISPLHASAGYLAYVRAAWNHRFSNYPLERQDVVLTLPASFDESARALTVQAAQLAGLPAVKLLEEPQAACYDWLTQHGDVLETALQDIRLLLVCDVGGGTTDLTLIKVGWEAGRPQLERIGVGDHLMLGGDNMDLTLAHVAEQRLIASGAHLSAANLSQLMQQCRTAKERLLTPNAPQGAKVTLLGAGAKLIRRARSITLSRDEVQAMVVEGFLPRIDPMDRPRKRRSAIVEFGLPYAADPAISRHVAAFLADHAQIAKDILTDHISTTRPLAVPDAVLLNGGVFHSQRLSGRLLEILAEWRGTAPRALRNDDPDLAVARGAVAFGLALRGKGLRIGGGCARSYFIQIEDRPAQQRGVCLLPQGTPEEREIRLKNRTFSLRLRQPVRFHLLSSTQDTHYAPGDVVDIDQEQFTLLPPIATVLHNESEPAGTLEIPVQLVAKLSEVGTLAVSCVSTEAANRRWSLDFQLRGGRTGQFIGMDHKPHPRLEQAMAGIDRIYGRRRKEVRPSAVKGLRVDLERMLGKRDRWETPLLRELLTSLLQGMHRRRRSVDHERLWFNLTGYCLRPGFGYPLDDWRVRQLWAIYKQGVQYTQNAQAWSEWWTLWRRVAGGLDEQAQQRIFKDISSALQPPKTRQAKRSARSNKQGSEDMIRLIASLERLSIKSKVQVGDRLLKRLRGPGESPQIWWAVGRIGARIPFYGSVHKVVPREVVAQWLEKTFALNWKSVQATAFAATLLARKSGDRERDVDPDIRDHVVQRLRAARASESWIRMVSQVVQLDEADERRVFGESLPPGLRLME
ncbi:MAG: Hsp70 family protein [Pseudomonadota bacterium]